MFCRAGRVASVCGLRALGGWLMAWLAACGTCQRQQVFQAFGQVKEVSMIPNADTGKHKGYGFIEFEEHEAATQAIAVSEAWGSGAGVQVRLAVVGMEARRWCGVLGGKGVWSLGSRPARR